MDFAIRLRNVTGYTTDHDAMGLSCHAGGPHRTGMGGDTPCKCGRPLPAGRREMVHPMREMVTGTQPPRRVEAVDVRARQAGER